MTKCPILAGLKCRSGEAGNILHIPARTGWADAEQDFRSDKMSRNVESVALPNAIKSIG